MAPTDAESLKALETVVQTATTLLQQLQVILGEIQRSPTAAGNTNDPSHVSTAPLDALALARDSASLVRAHATKVSLLIINEPFTPSAVTAVVRELITGPIPGLASAVEACDMTLYTAVFRRELAWRIQRVFSELSVLLAQIPKDGKVVADSKRSGMGPDGKGSITSTGVLWSACDNVTKLANMGVGGFFVSKVEEWRDTLKDVMEELKEWGEEEADEEEDDEDEEDEVDDLADGVQSTHISTQAMVDDLMNSSNSIPASDPDGIRPRLEASLRRLRLVVLLYQAITKRRLKKLPALPPKGADAATIPQRLEDAAKVLQQLPVRFEDLTAAFYDLQPAGIDKATEQCFKDAISASELLSETWDCGRDEFTEWTEKFKVEIKKD